MILRSLLVLVVCFMLLLKSWRWRRHLWYRGQSSWLQIQKSGFDSRHCQIFWKVVGLERGQLSLVSTIEEVLGRESSGSGLEIWEYSRRDPSRRLHGTFYLQKLALTSSTSGCRSVGIVHSRTQATEFSFLGGDMFMRKPTGFQRTIQRCISEDVFGRDT
jgi:hypothetical protein